MRRNAELTTPQQLTRIYTNLRCEYKFYIKQNDFETLDELLTLIDQYEDLKKAQGQLNQKHFNQKQINPNQLNQNHLNQKYLSQSLPVHKTFNKPKETTSNYQNQPRTLHVLANYDRKTCCWKCGQAGHTRLQCGKPPILFCSYCGKEGILTKNCNCWSGNATRTKPFRDHLRPSAQRSQ